MRNTKLHLVGIVALLGPHADSLGNQETVLCAEHIYMLFTGLILPQTENDCTRKSCSVQLNWSLQPGMGIALSFQSMRVMILLCPGTSYSRTARFAAKGVTVLPHQDLSAGTDGSFDLQGGSCIHYSR